MRTLSFGTPATFSWRVAFWLPALLLILPLTAASAAGPVTVDFGHDVLPILSDKCFHCHGPDAKTRKGNLRLDVAEDALRKKEPVIVPGNSEESEFIQRIISADETEAMPPPTSNRSLSSAQKETLKRWVDQGAKWGKHWAFVAPGNPSPPPAARNAWSRNAIDGFVLAKLEKEGLSPAQDAKRETLLRRVTLDLTGLPPTLAEVDAFLGDPAPDAFERVVDRLLASRRYGERMATEWLDLARYADTHGYQMDRYRPMWPWRDWVISSFNRNQPFDQFITWQLAGDLLPRASKEQRLATAFNRLHMQNEEGGIVEEEYRVAYVVDRVNTMGTAFLGLTFECSRCHDHKYDPITQRDFYSLFAFFQNIDESGQTSYFTSAMPVPTLLLSDRATDDKLDLLEQKIAAKERALQEFSGSAGDAFQAWLTSRSGTPPVPGRVASFAFDTLAASKTPNDADPAKPAVASDSPELVAGKNGKAVALDGEDGFSFPDLAHFTRVDPFTFALWLNPAQRSPRDVVLHHTKAPIDAGSRGYEILLEDGKIAVGLHYMWPGNSLKVVTKKAVPTGAWTHLGVTYDGSSRASGIRVYLDGIPAAVEVVRDGLYKDITYDGGPPNLTLGFRFRDHGFQGGRVDDLQIFDRALTPLEVAQLAGRADLRDAWNTPANALTASQRDGLLRYMLATDSPDARKLAEELHALRRDHNALVTPIAEAMVMKELPQPKPAFILKRGGYDTPGESVSANTPGAMLPFPAGEPRNRLGLARWLLSPDHPLTARVTVNRFWQMMFGKGLVETSDNFGNQGALPTHPELLDWLAREFIASGWDVKHLLKLIATSSTYRQSSHASAALLALDPGNQLLARGPARRLTAEMLRDQALSVSGLLVDTIGGPSVKPYQPEGLWDVAMGRPQYDRSKGADLYRRSLYSYWKRTVPHPAMVTFDAADRNVCAVRRQSTSTPLQALALLNDIQVVEAARGLSQRMLREGGTSDRDRASWAFQVVTGRQPTDREAVILERLLAEQRALFAADRPAALALLALGDAPVDASLDPIDLAAGTVLAEAILNHDEAVLRR